MTNIISLIRFTIGDMDVLEPFTELVNYRFQSWMTQQQKAGHSFSPEQVEWLTMIKDHIASSLSIEMEDFELSPFHEKGGAVKVYRIFGSELEPLLKELNEVLVA